MELNVAADIGRWTGAPGASTSLRRRLCRFALTWGVLLLAGCCGFDREWKRAAAQVPGTNELAGRWEGLWMSNHNGHNGRLRCLINDRNEARFHAKYRKIFSFGYTVPLDVQRSNDLFLFVGEADLGKLAGGVYHYAGTVTGTNFHSTYRRKYDHGYFRMNRVK